MTPVLPIYYSLDCAIADSVLAGAGGKAAAGCTLRPVASSPDGKHVGLSEFASRVAAALQAAVAAGIKAILGLRGPIKVLCAVVIGVTVPVGSFMLFGGWGAVEYLANQPANDERAASSITVKPDLHVIIGPSERVGSQLAGRFSCVYEVPTTILALPPQPGVHGSVIASEVARKAGNWPYAHKHTVGHSLACVKRILAGEPNAKGTRIFPWTQEAENNVWTENLL